MDEDIFPELCLMNTKKTYSKTPKKQGNAPPVSNNVKEASKPSGKVSELGEPLTTKVAVEYLLSGKLKSEVCRYCLRISPGLSELDQIMQIAGTGAVYKITIREMIACFYPFKVSENQEFPESICQKCVDKALNAYLFTQQCEQAERALNNCFIDMDEKLTKLDPIDRPKKRGRQKLKPNYNVLYAEHKKVMDYAEPIRHLINLQTESLSNEPDWNEFECKKCWQVLPNLETLLNHEKLHPKTMWYHCRLCGKAFIKHNQLKKHHTQVHVRGKQMPEADKTFKCRECGNVTDNYEQHLQHIEKHKFKSVMEHLIEKKTDQLCLICLKKSSNLVELDKMVCIHGSCPELVGDKTLYTVLASTLPDRKSYKYQELHIPQKANLMTITKRKRKYQETEEDNIEIKFDWSNPIIVKAEKFKTDDFYYYVFCDPDLFIISTNERNTNNFDVQVSKCIEITDEVAMELDKDSKSETDNEMDVPDHLKSVHKSLDTSDEEELIKMSIHDNINEITDTNIKSLKDDTIEINFAKNAKVDDAEMDFNRNNYDEIATNSRQDKDITNKINKTRDKINVVEHYPETGCTNNQKLSIFVNAKEMDENNFTDKKSIGYKLNTVPSEYFGPNIFPFSNPIILETDILNIKKDTLTIFNFSNPEFENSENEVINFKAILEKNINKDIMGPVNKTTGLNWIFDKTLTKNYIETAESSKIIEDCKFCWIFTKQNKCEYCKKPINVVNDKKSENNTTIDIVGLEKSTEMKENIKQDILKAWQCIVCLTENNKDRFTCCCCESKKYIENGNCKITFGNNNAFFEITKKQDISENNVSTAKTAEPFITEETSMMDMKCETIEVADKETNTIQSMDIETYSVNYNFNTKVTEQMDIEEYVPVTNLVPTFAPTQTLGAHIGPFIGANVQFNIGSQFVQNDKGGRRIKRAVRNIPKAFHK
nr:uncharacterized protein LOC110382912 isoform X1 [Helicoverpa armigera]